MLAAAEFGLDRLSQRNPISYHQLRTIPFTDVNPYGANFFLQGEVEHWKIDKTMQMARDAGIKWMKQHFPWEEIQLSPGRDGYWDPRLNRNTWDKYDFIVETARKYGLNIIARLDRPPAWTRQDNRRPEAPPDDFNAYGDFVYDFVSRYKGKIGYLQIWNEPNIYPEWGERSPNPAGYVELLRIASHRAREADPNIVILSAPLAQTLEVSQRNMADLDYLERMYELGARQYFDIMFVNAYGFAFPPEDPPDPNRLNFQRVLLLRQIMEKNGDTNKAVWFNEFGWNTAPADFPPEKLLWARVDEEKQAAYTVQAIQMAREQWPWAGVFSIWYFRQAGNILPDQPEYYFRMVDVGFTPRPLYNRVREATQELRKAGPGEYGPDNPAADYSAGWRDRPNPLGAGPWLKETGKAGESATITFQGGGILLRVLSGPAAGRLYATIDGHETNLLPRDREGRSLLDLNLTGQPEIVEVQVASGLNPGVHVLRLSVADDQPAQVALGGFKVTSPTSSSLLGYWPSVGGVLVGLALFAGVTFAGRRRR